jgi:hypothetical protein
MSAWGMLTSSGVANGEAQGHREENRRSLVLENRGRNGDGRDVGRHCELRDVKNSPEIIQR